MGDRHYDAAPLSSLYGRQTECAALDGLLDRVRGGRSAVLVLRGEAGIGKTALLRYVTDRAARFRVVRCMGVEAEMELAFAGLHDLCTPLLSWLDGWSNHSAWHSVWRWVWRQGSAPTRSWWRWRR